MKPRYHSYLWMIRILGVFILTVGMTSPVFAADPPAWTIDKTHVGDFTQGDQNKVYTITVTNSGSGATDGSLITMTDTLPAGLIPQTITSGDPAWTCPTGDITGLTVLTCTRTAVMNSGASSVITLTVDVAVDAGQGADIEDPIGSQIFYKTVTNSVMVSGGGSLDPDTNNDITRILQKPDLVIIGWELRNAANNAVITNPQPDEEFIIRMTVKNRGGRATGLFYPGVFLDGKPNYGPDHAPLGQVTSFSDFRMTPAGSLGKPKGCLYYDPAGTIDPTLVEVDPERGNYTRSEFNSALDPGATRNIDVRIAYPADDPQNTYNDDIYDTDNVRVGLKAGSYQIYLYVDPNCSAGEEESYEDNNFLKLPVLNIGSLPSGPTDVDVTIGGVLKGTYPMDPGESMVQSYINAFGGPVVIKSNNGVGIIASTQQLRRSDMTQNLWPGIMQLMGVRQTDLSDKYVFPIYSNLDATKYEILLLANFDTIDTNVTVKIGNTTYGPYSVPHGTSYIFNQVVQGGPVVVSSDNGAEIIASLYQLKRAGTSGRWTGQSEMMGIPLSQLSNTYVFPIYDYTSLGLLPSLNFANVDTIATNITVTIGGVLKGTYPMAAGTSMVVTYSGVMGGPVVISSNNGAKIIASMQQLRRINLTVNQWTGIMQLMGVRQANLSDTYVFPIYSNLDPATKYEILLLANFDTIDTNVTVKVGNTTYGPYSVPHGTSYIFNQAVQGGPVVVSSNNGAEIIASLYQLKRAVSTTRWNDQSEMMGIPLSQLSNTYVFPIYDYTSPGLLPSLNFAVP